MSHIDNDIAGMHQPSPGRSELGFSLIEVLVATTVMLIVIGAIFSLLGSSMKVAKATYEMTDAQQNLRTSQEFINRDLMNAGDGMKSINGVRVSAAFMLAYVTLAPVLEPAPPAGIAKLGIFNSDNNVPAGTAITGAVPAANVRTNTDRQTILALDSDFASITLSAVAADGSTVTLPVGTAMTLFNIGEVYFLSSGASATFGTITAINVGTRQLSFATGDAYGFNSTGANGHITFVLADLSVTTTLQRMKVIQYYVTDTKLLMRRVFGIQGAGGAGMRASIIAEHVLNVQFNYTLISKNLATGVVTPSQTTILATNQDQLNVRQVEVTVTVETPHALQNGGQPQMQMTTATSVRNMQFRSN